ncbi:ATP-binding protein [Paenibacillus sp. YIM B09110]|uniref:ATP-binding protein n=1 Tax=Paenibacillus sp. YIM B09110 TaxID=3126102 RepID=UPI00301C7001
MFEPEARYMFQHSGCEERVSGELELMDYTLYHIEELTFEDKAPRKEAFENVISSIRVPGISFIYLIVGNQSGVSFYFGIARDLASKTHSPLNIRDIGEQILAPSLKGNFRGSTVRSLSPREKVDLKAFLNDLPAYGLMEGVPGVDEDNEQFQGIDRLIDVMIGDVFALTVIAKPVAEAAITEMEHQLYQMYSKLTPFVKKNVQDSFSESSGKSDTFGTSLTDTTGSNASKAESQSSGSSTTETTGTNKSTSQSTNRNNTNNSGSSSSSQTGDSKGGQQGSSESRAVATNKGTNVSETNGTSESRSDGTTKSETLSTTDSKSNAVTLEYIDKKVQDWIQYMDDILFPRVDYGKSKGLYITAVSLGTVYEGSLWKLGHIMQSLFAAKAGNKIPLKLHRLPKGHIRKSLLEFQIPEVTLHQLTQNEMEARIALSQSVSPERSYLGNWYSSNELSVLAGLPHKEVVGLTLKEEVEFGLNVPKHARQPLPLGHLVQSGRVLEHISVPIDKEVMNKHIFVTGVTGSGKTTTCQKLLLESEMPFLVIEPAKTEYRIMRRAVDSLYIFTLGHNTVAPFRLNPFEFFPHESITSRVDMIKAAIEASFDMEAAIPQIIETAIYECYKDYGWNIALNKNTRFSDPFADGVYAFPTLSDLIEKVESVVRDQGFDERLKNDYIGSIRARLQGLLVGAKGLMLNTKRSIDFNWLSEQRVILELEEIKSGSEKSLIMGFVLMNLVEVLKGKHKKGERPRHITLLEEAHRLLSKYSPGDSMNKKQGVEVFTDMLAEVRKYGESLIIVDQIPSKLTPEVLKNTNTKIVHKLFAQDDKEVIGNTMALQEEQRNFLSHLDVGRAIVFTQGWSKAVQVAIEPATDTTSETNIAEAELREQALLVYQSQCKRGVLPGLELYADKPSVSLIESYLSFIQGHSIIEAVKDLLNNRPESANYPFQTELKRVWMEEIPYDLFVSFFMIELFAGMRQEQVDQKHEVFEKLLKALAAGESIQSLQLVIVRLKK